MFAEAAAGALSWLSAAFAGTVVASAMAAAPPNKMDFKTPSPKRKFGWPFNGLGLNRQQRIRPAAVTLDERS
jgi:hypothetical protein